MESNIILNTGPTSSGEAEITPVIKLHVHFFKTRDAWSFYATIEPVYVKINYKGTSKIFHISGEAISTAQFETVRDSL